MIQTSVDETAVAAVFPESRLKSMKHWYDAPHLKEEGCIFIEMWLNVVACYGATRDGRGSRRSESHGCGCLRNDSVDSAVEAALKRPLPGFIMLQTGDLN
jgi:hypothetical protein